MSDRRAADGSKAEMTVVGEGKFRIGSRGREKGGAGRASNGGGGEEGGGGVRGKTRRVNEDGLHPKMSLTISFSGIYQRMRS